ncbi:hypothetical protein HY249_02585 [Candidatus Azambacteria bacterium]|nr:hypothetical protein [Candidatus Azambacteria bacterium]
MEETEQDYIQNLNIARGNGGEPEEGEENTESIELPEEKIVNFPFLMFLAALIKDASDLVPFLGFITTPIFFLCVFFWFLNKDPEIKKGIIGKQVMKGIAAFIAGLIPIAGAIIPEASLFVFLVYLSEKKKASEINSENGLEA